MGPTGCARRIACLTVLLQLLACGLRPGTVRGAPAEGTTAGTTDRPAAQRLEVEIISPEDGASLTEPSVLIQAVVRTAPGVTVRLHPLVNGQPLPEAARGLVVMSEQKMQAQGGARVLEREQLYALKVPLPPQSCTVAVVAETDSASRTSNPVRLNFRGNDPFRVKPKLYVLSIGVSTYRDGGLSLGYASKDAADFAQAFLDQQGGLYEQVSIRLLLNAQATRDRILDGLQWLQRQTTAKDMAILFLAGHGIDDPSSGVYYFLPHDAEEGAVMRSMISQQSLQTVLRSIAGKTLLFLDTCHAASVMNGAAGRAVSDISRLVQELAAVDNGLVVYAAASGRQLSQESSRWSNGAFTKAVVEGLRGRAAYHADRPITVQMLNLYVSERVKELTAGAQTPILVTTNKLADFPLALAGQRPPAPAPAPAPLSLQPSQPVAVYRPPWLAPLPSGESRPAPPPAPVAPPGLRRPSVQPSVPTAPAPKPAEPVHRKAWFWLTLGGAALLVGGLAIAGGVVASTGSAMGPAPGDGSALTFTKIE